MNQRGVGGRPERIMITRVLEHPWGWTTLAPIACAAHCLATPVLAVTAPAVVTSTVLEWGFLLTTLLLGSFAFRSGLRTHGDLRPLLALLGGVVLWSLSLAGGFAPFSEELTTTGAALTAAFGMVWNSRLHCSSTRHDCHACRAEESLGAEASPTSRVTGEPATG